MNDELLELCRKINRAELRGHKPLLKGLIQSQSLLSLLDTMSSGQFAWHVVNDNWIIPVCKTCGGKVRFNPYTRQYQKFCCKECSYNDQDRIKKIADTMEQRYGARFAANSPILMAKKKKTLMEKYGVDHQSKSPAIKLKKKQTMRDKWGVDNPSQSSEIQQRKIDTNRRKRGVDWAPQDPTVQEKQRQTNQLHWGVDHSLSNPEVRAKAKQTMIEKYGVENPQQNVEIRTATLATNLERYGTEYPAQSDEIKAKMLSTCIERYGSVNWFSSEIGQTALKEIHLAKRGVENPSQDPIVRAKMKQTILDRYGVTHNNYIGKTPEQIEALTDSTKFILAVTGLTIQAAAEKLGVIESTIYRLSREYDCRSVLAITSRAYEKKITDFLDENNINYLTNVRTVIAPLELDIYIPDKNIAIEVGAFFWHCDQYGRGSEYHYGKWDRCKEQNIGLFQLFDDELFDNWELTKHKLLRALDISVPVINVNEVEITKCTIEEEQEFLDKWHNPGYSAERTETIACKFNNKIIAILTINEFIIEKWATDLTISCPGLLSKALEYLNSTGEITVITDNRMNDGQEYKSAGFFESHVIEPKYWYFKKDSLEDPADYPKEKLIEMFNLDDSVNELSEIEIMRTQGYNVLWDAGYTLWVKNIQK